MTSTNTTDTRCCSASTGRSRSAPRRAKHALIPVTDWTSRPAPRIPRPSDPRVSPAWRRFGRPSTLARSPVTREDSPFRPHRREPEKTPGRSERLPALFSERFGGLPKRPKGADCKSAGKRLRRFESFAPHQRPVRVPTSFAASPAANSFPHPNTNPLTPRLSANGHRTGPSATLDNAEKVRILRPPQKKVSGIRYQASGLRQQACAVSSRRGMRSAAIGHQCLSPLREVSLYRG